MHCEKLRFKHIAMHFLYGVEKLIQYILNIYKILFTRGMLGTYVYVCDDGLRNYLRKYLPLPS